MGRRIRYGAIAAGLVAALAFSIPFLVPASHYIPQLTRIASEKLDQPVAIEDLQLRLVPTPRLVATGITVGKNSDVSVGELEIVPDLASFAIGPRTIRLIRAEKVQLKESALAIPRTIPKGGDGEQVGVQRIVLSKVKLSHPSVQLAEFDLNVRLRDGFVVEQASFATTDGALVLNVEPKDDDVTAVSLTARNWTLPAGAALAFESIAAQGTLKGQQLDLPRIEGRMYGGNLAGSARADWAKQWQLAGKVKLAGVDLVPLQKALGKHPKLSGRLKAEAVFSTRAKKPEQLTDALAVDGPFEVVGGAYQGVDLAKAGELTGKRGAGGATAFQELRGKLQLRNKAVRISELCVRSPQVVAGGHLEIAADQKLSGKLDVSVAKTGGFVGVPVALTGTASEPGVIPSKGYLIGAAIGTVLLPGVGTSIGSSVGSRIEGMSGCK